jgi:hypothetical protein
MGDVAEKDRVIDKMEADIFSRISAERLKDLVVNKPSALSKDIEAQLKSAKDLSRKAAEFFYK